MEGLGAMYRNVKTSIWHDEKFFGLSDVAQLVWFHVYTNPLSNGLGLYHAPIEGLAAAKRMDLERYREGFEECLRNRLFEYDERFQTVYFPNYLKHNKPANPNVMQGLLKIWPSLPDSPLKLNVFKSLEDLGKRYRERLEKIGITIPQIRNRNRNRNKTVKSDDFTVCGEPSGSPPAVAVEGDPSAVITLPTNRHATIGETHSVTDADLAEYTALYPAVDVPQALRSMRGWLLANPGKRKTLNGMPRFIHTWLSREQNRGGAHGPHAQLSAAPARRLTPAQQIRENLAECDQAPPAHAQPVAGADRDVRPPVDLGDGHGADGDLVGSLRGPR